MEQVRVGQELGRPDPMHVVGGSAWKRIKVVYIPM